MLISVRATMRGGGCRRLSLSWFLNHPLSGCGCRLTCCVGHYEHRSGARLARLARALWVEHNGTFNQRYMVGIDYWDKKANAPIFFFTGAEGGDITKVYDYAYAYVQDVAKSMGAMLVYMEHRYFGFSQPFGAAESYRPT